MPVYDYQCACGEVAEVFKPIARLDDPELCKCGKEMSRMLAAPAVIGDYQPYRCPISGEMISGRKAHMENLAKHGCRVLEAGEREQAERARRAADEKLENDMAETAAKLVETMPYEKRQRLETELANGMSAAYTRG